jgi:regulator of protease activity HflC (stomatin/prohibitin superfamily)
MMTLLMVTSLSVVTIDAGEVGVVTNSANGDLRGTVLTNGWHFDPRYATSNIDTIRYNTQVSEYIGKDKMDDIDGSVMVMSSDQMYIYIDMSVSYNITESEAASLRFTYGPDWKIVIVHQVSRSVPRTECANFTALEIVGIKRAEIERKITEEIVRNIEIKGEKSTGINVVDVKIREMRIPSGLQDAVEQRIIAEQLYEKAQMDLKRIKVEAEAEYERIIKIAEADAKVIDIIAKANAKAINDVLKEFTDSGGDPDIAAYLAYMYIQALTDPNSNITYVIVPNDGTGVFVTLPP